MKRVIFNYNQLGHYVENDSHPLRYLENKFFGSNLSLEITFPSNLEKYFTKNPKCSRCEQYLFDQLRLHKEKISKLTLNIKDSSIMVLLETVIFQVIVRNVDELSLKFSGISLKEVKPVLDKILELSLKVKTFHLYLYKCQNSLNEPSITLLKGLKNINTIQKFSIQIIYVGWNAVQLSSFFQKDTLYFPQNLESFSMELSQMKIEKEMIQNCFTHLNKVISPSLKRFELTLDYTQGEESFKILTNSLLQATNLDKLIITFFNRPVDDDFIVFLNSVLKNLQAIQTLHFSCNQCSVGIDTMNKLLSALLVKNDYIDLNLNFKNQCNPLFTENMKPSLLKLESSFKQLFENNLKLKSINLNLENIIINKIHDIYNEDTPIQFTNIFPQEASKISPHLEEYHFQDCLKSGLDRYLSYVQTAELLRPKLNSLSNFLTLSTQIQKLSLQDIAVDLIFLQNFSQFLREAQFMKELTIKFRNSNGVRKGSFETKSLFEGLDNLEIINIHTDYLSQYVEFFQNPKVKQATYQRIYNDDELHKYLLTFKVQKLFLLDYAKIPAISFPPGFNENEFVKIILLKSGGNELLFYLPTLIISPESEFTLQRLLRKVMLQIVSFQNIIQETLIYSPQQIIYDLYD